MATLKKKSPIEGPKAFAFHLRYRGLLSLSSKLSCLARLADRTENDMRADEIPLSQKLGSKNEVSLFKRFSTALII